MINVVTDKRKTDGGEQRPDSLLYVTSPDPGGRNNKTFIHGIYAYLYFIHHTVVI